VATVPLTVAVLLVAFLGLLGELLAAGAVRVDGEERPKSFHLAGGETVEADTALLERQPLTPQEVPFTIVHEDTHLLVVDKPAGVVVHPTPGRTTGTLVHGLLEHGIVVRPGESFGIGGEGYCRAALVPTLDQIERAISAWEAM